MQRTQVIPISTKTLLISIFKNCFQENLNAFDTDNSNEILNAPISLEKITSIIQLCKNSAPGSDQIPNVLIKNLPNEAIIYIEKLTKTIWFNGSFPKQWSLAIVIPIAKSGKDKTSSKNYRPISLTNNLCKIMEKTLNKRLKSFLEANQVFPSQQSGFRENRWTYDHLINLEAAICDAFRKKLYLIAVSLDIEKAVQNGVPQGSVFSVTLFLLVINKIVKIIDLPIQCSLFVDDLTLYCSGKNLEITIELLQQTLRRSYT